MTSVKRKEAGVMGADTRGTGGFTDDWTRDDAGPSNSSADYLRLVDVVAAQLRNLRVGGDAVAEARTIVSTLAHEHGLAPVREVVGARRWTLWFCPRCGSDVIEHPSDDSAERWCCMETCRDQGLPEGERWMERVEVVEVSSAGERDVEAALRELVTALEQHPDLNPTMRVKTAVDDARATLRALPSAGDAERVLDAAIAELEREARSRNGAYWAPGDPIATLRMRRDRILHEAGESQVSDDGWPFDDETGLPKPSCSSGSGQEGDSDG